MSSSFRSRLWMLLILSVLSFSCVGRSRKSVDACTKSGGMQPPVAAAENQKDQPAAVAETVGQPDPLQVATTMTCDQLYAKDIDTCEVGLAGSPDRYNILLLCPDNKAFKCLGACKENAPVDGKYFDDTCPEGMVLKTATTVTAADTAPQGYEKVEVATSVKCDQEPKLEVDVCEESEDQTNGRYDVLVSCPEQKAYLCNQSCKAAETATGDALCEGGVVLKPVAATTGTNGTTTTTVTEQPAANTSATNTAANTPAANTNAPAANTATNTSATNTAANIPDAAASNTAVDGQRDQSVSDPFSGQQTGNSATNQYSYVNQAASNTAGYNSAAASNAPQSDDDEEGGCD